MLCTVYAKVHTLHTVVCWSLVRVRSVRSADTNLLVLFYWFLSEKEANVLVKQRGMLVQPPLGMNIQALEFIYVHRPRIIFHEMASNFNHFPSALPHKNDNQCYIDIKWPTFIQLSQQTYWKKNTKGNYLQAHITLNQILLMIPENILYHDAANRFRSKLLRNILIEALINPVFNLYYGFKNY